MPGKLNGNYFFRQFYLQIFTHLFSIPQSQHRFINLLTLDEIKPPPHIAFYRLSIEKLQFLNSNHFTSIVHNIAHLILYHLLPIWMENSWNVKSKLEKFERKYFSLLRIDVVVEISSEKKINMNKSLVYREIPSVVSVSGFYHCETFAASPQYNLHNTFNIFKLIVFHILRWTAHKVIPNFFLLPMIQEFHLVIFIIGFVLPHSFFTIFFYELNLMWKNKNPTEERWKSRNVKLSFSERIDIEKRWRTKIFQFTKRSDNSYAISIAAVLSLRNGAPFPFLILSCLRCFSFSYFIRVFPFHILHSSNLCFLYVIE